MTQPTPGQQQAIDQILTGGTAGFDTILGLEYTAVTADGVEATLTLRPELHQPFGITHGGMIFAFADSCFALTCNDPEADGSTITVASGVDVNFMAPTKAGQTLVAGRPLVERNVGVIVRIRFDVGQLVRPARVIQPRAVVVDLDDVVGRVGVVGRR